MWQLYELHGQQLATTPYEGEGVGIDSASYSGQERVIQEAPFCPISGVRGTKCSNTPGMVPVQPVT